MQVSLLLAAVLSAVASACEWGWQEIDGKCYKLQRSRNTWTMQNFACVYDGGSLASITSWRENENVRRAANGQEIYTGGASFGYNWEWSDGEYFHGFSNWLNAEDRSPPLGKPCVKMTSDGYWKASCCAHPPAPAVCVRKY